MKNKRPLWLAALTVCAALCFSACGNSAQEQEPVQTQPPAATQPAVEETQPVPEQTQPQPLLQILSTREEGEYVQVTTTHGNFRYPFAFSEVVQMQSLQDREGLDFFMMVEDLGVKLFTVYFDETGAIPLGAMTVDGEEKLLTADIYAAPDTLDDTGKHTFYAAQEIFNDVAVSLQENENFAPIN